MICTPISTPNPQKKFCRTFEGNIAENEVSSILMKLLGKHTDTEHLQFLYISDILVLLHSLIEIFYTLNTSFQNDPDIKNKGLISL